MAEGMFEKGRKMAQTSEEQIQSAFDANRAGLQLFAKQSSVELNREVAKLRAARCSIGASDGGVGISDRLFTVNGLLCMPICFFVRERTFFKNGFFLGERPVKRPAPFAGIAAISNYDFSLRGPGKEYAFEIIGFEYERDVNLCNSPAVEFRYPRLSDELSFDCKTVDEVLFRLGSRGILEDYCGKIT